LKKQELQKEETESKNRLSWFELDKTNSDDKARLIEEFGCTLIFDAKKMEVYKIEKVDL